VDYPWYEVTEDKLPLQGDFLARCPILVPPNDFSVETKEQQEQPSPEIQVKVETFDVVIMSQSCDLAQRKLRTVLVCPHWSVENFAQSQSGFSNKQLEQLRCGNLLGYHMLDKCSLPQYERPIQIVDFRSTHSLPLDHIFALANRDLMRLRLLAPYREHLAQAFARFLMRVGLPTDIPRFIQ